MDQYLNKDGLDALWRKILNRIGDIESIDTEWERIQAAFEEAGYVVTKEQIRAHQIAVEHKIIAESGTIDDFHPGVIKGDYSVMFEGNTYMLIPPAVSKYIYGTGTADRSAHAMFKNCSNMVTIPQIAFARITDMSEMFKGCVNLRSIPIINMGSVETSESMFENCMYLADSSTLLFGSVNKNTSKMFKNCIRLLSVNNIDLTEVTNASSMFDGCLDLEELYFTGLKKCTDFTRMFAGCAEIKDEVQNQISFSPSYDTSIRLESMFSGCSKVVSPVTLTNMLTSTSNVEINAKNMYSGSGINQLKDATITLSRSETDLTGAFSSCTDLEYIGSTIHITVRGANKLNLSGLFKNCTNLERMTGDYKILYEYSPSLLDRILVNFDSMFEGCTNLTSAPGSFLIKTKSDYENIGCIQRANNMFNGCTSMDDSIPDTFGTLENSMINLEQADGMFKGCENITNIPRNTSYKALTTAKEMFKGCSHITKANMINGKKTSAVVDRSPKTDTYIGAVYLIIDNNTYPIYSRGTAGDYYIDKNHPCSLGKYNVGDIINASSEDSAMSSYLVPESCSDEISTYTYNSSNHKVNAFASSTHIRSAKNVNFIVTSKETLYDAEATIQVLGEVYTFRPYLGSDASISDSLINATSMFEGCANLTYFSKVTDELQIADNMFKGCTNLSYMNQWSEESTGRLSVLDCSKLTSAESMFEDACKSTISGERAVWPYDSNGLKNAKNMFKNSGINELWYLDLSNAEDVSGIFDGCSSLHRIVGGIGALHDASINISETGTISSDDWSDITKDLGRNNIITVSANTYTMLNTTPYKYDTSKTIQNVLVVDKGTTLIQIANE